MVLQHPAIRILFLVQRMNYVTQNNQKIMQDLFWNKHEIFSVSIFLPTAWWRTSASLIG